MTEKEAYEFFDKYIRQFLIMRSIMVGVGFQTKINTWKFDICQQLIKNGGYITVIEALKICDLDDASLLLNQDWAHPQ